MKLEDNLYLYTIPAPEQERLGFNIYVMICGKEAMLIDCGYARDMVQVLSDLNNQNIEVVSVLPSHFHPDHVKGLDVLDSPTVYGNKHAKKAIRRFSSKKNIERYMPTELIACGDKIKFGDFMITLEHAPGHSDCSMLININDKYLHSGDLYIKTDRGGEVLPYVSWRNMKAHMNALKKILEYKGHVLLISHGKSPVFEGDYKLGIQDRLTYMQAVIDGNNKIAVKDAVKACKRPFENMKWRE